MSKIDGCASSEAELVDGLLRADPEAWRTFHERYDRLALRCIADVLRPFAKRLGSDAVREVHATFLFSLQQRDMHKLRVFDAEKGRALSSWIGRLATNCAIDHVRKHARWVSVELDEEACDVTSRAPDPHAAMMGRLRLEAVRAAVRGLTERDRELVELSFEECLPAEEIAARMGVSVKTVYSKSHKIREKLKTALESADLAA